MDHQEKHHQKKEKEHEEEKKERRVHELQAEKKGRLPFHPAWLVVVGAVLALAAILIWTFIVWPMWR